MQPFRRPWCDLYARHNATAENSKNQNVWRRQIEVRLVGDYFDKTLEHAQTFCADEGAYFLSPFDDDDVIEGQASVAVEIEDQLGRAPDHIILPVGGGGLSAGTRAFFGDRCTYTFVEPSGAPSLGRALEGGAPIDVSPINSFVDGAAVAKIGVRTFEKLKDVQAVRCCASL